MGNSRARAVYEAQLPDGFRRPQTDSALESFIRAKYEHKKYVAREWVQPPPVKANWDKEIEEEMEKQKRKKKGLGIASTATNNGKPADTKKSTISLKSTPIPAPLPKPTVSLSLEAYATMQGLSIYFTLQTNTSSPKTSSRVANNNSTSSENTSTNDSNLFSSDLLGLSSPTATVAASVDNVKMTADHNDVFSCFLSGPTSSNPNEKNCMNVANATQSSISNSTKSPTETSLAQEEQDFFNQIPTEKEKAKLTKDSILALYGQAPPIGQFNQPTNNQFVPQMMGANAMNPIGNVTYGAGIPMQYQTAPGAALFGNMPTMQQSTAPTAVNSFGFSATMPQNAFPPNPTNNANNLSQPFGSLNLGNVWQWNF